MLESIGDFISNALLLIGLFCLAGTVLTLIAGYIFIRRLNSFVSPDVPKMLQELEDALAKNPNANRRKIMQRIINRQSFKAGVVGAFTGLGGFYTLPVALPADIILSMRIQAATVDFIARAFGQTAHTEVEERVRNYLITTGGVRATESATRTATRYALRFVGRGFSKLIPIISALISFGVNYAFAQAGANIALRYYAQKDNPRLE